MNNRASGKSINVLLWPGKLFFLILLSGMIARAEQICEFRLTKCPETYDGDTIIVPEYVAALSSNIRACLSSVMFLDTSNQSHTPSIMFVIDNSGSMTGVGADDANDQFGSRFTVTRALLDTIHKTQPNAEVGIAVFTNHLNFDPRTNEYFSQYFQRMPKTYDDEPDQAYLSFIELNEQYGSRKGIDIIKDVLATDTVDTTKNNNPYSYVDLVYKPDFEINRSTNINMGFEAVKDAMNGASNPPERQFVIFLSDGDARGNEMAGYDDRYYFSKGENVPTTFTVFFTSSGDAPSSLETMADNVKQNGYSVTNPKSALWTIQTSHDDLMDLFMEKILTNILIPGNPTRIMINERSSTAYMDSSFIFAGGFSLSDTLTPFSLDINYRYRDTTDNIINDSTITSQFFVKRVAGASVPDNIELYCEEVITPDSIPVTAALLDTNGDGHLDRIDLTWSDNRALRDSMPTVSELVTLLQIATREGKTVALSADTMEVDTANQTIRVILEENTVETLETGWDSAQVQLAPVPVAGDGSYFYIADIVDRAGPVIKTARYYRDPQTGRDSLIVEFSEPVIWQSSSVIPPEVFNYYRLDTLKDEAFSETDASDLGQIPAGAIVMMTGDFLPVGGIDSLQLDDNSRIVDSSGTAPPENGRKAPVLYAGGEPWAGAIVNPFTPGVDDIPYQVRNFYDNVIYSQSGSNSTSGTIIGIQSQGPLERQSDGSYGKAVVYDAVANMVRKNLRVYQETTTDYGVFWDGLNANGRRVGGGAYLLVISTTDINGDTQTTRVKLGVKR
ncbi:MAG: hypothetical protein GF401_13950 [Chitinivibrionales bacterium]|nr:hypothetical protein [Chitinivibrionales bacterium]